MKYFIFPFSNNETPQPTLQLEDSVGHALFLGYAEKTFGTRAGRSKQINQQLARAHPERFSAYKPALIHPLNDYRDK